MLAITALSLAGDIGVNFWMELDGRYDYPENYMLFTVNNRTQKVLVSEAERAPGSPRYRIFRCGVTAKEMTDKVTAQFYLAGIYLRHKYRRRAIRRPQRHDHE